MLATEPGRKILIVDRDVAALEPLRQKLSEAGFAVRAITDGAAALAAVAERPPHLVIIDWNIGGFAAVELVRVVRGAPSAQPVRLIILSALAGEQEVVMGLNAGADDCVAKPFSLREVVVRVSVVLRQRPLDGDRPELECDGLVLESSTNRVTAQGRLLNLRGVEYRLLEFLMSHPGRTYNRTQLLSHVWGGDSEVDEQIGISDGGSISVALSGTGRSVDGAVSDSPMPLWAYGLLATLLMAISVRRSRQVTR